MGKKINWYAVTVTLVCIALAIMLFLQRCTGDVTPGVTSTATQIKVFEKDSIAIKKQADSFNLILNKQYAIDKENKEETERLFAENIQLYNDNQSLKGKPLFVDTCKELDTYWNLKYSTYANQTQQAIKSGQHTISSLTNTVISQKQFLSAKDTAYKKIKTAWDTCISNASKLEKINKSLQPRRSILIGLATNVYPKFGVGLNLSLQNKKGTIFEVQAMQIYSSTHYSIGIKKTLFKF